MRTLLFLCCSWLAYAQAGGTEPKKTAEEYDVHAQLKDVALGAEYMVHSYSGQGQMYIAADFLVVEVALYPSKDTTLTPPKYRSLKVDPGAFTLRVNGKKALLLPVSVGTVAATLQNSEWQNRPYLEAGGGMGNTGVILGRPNPTNVPGGQPQGRLPRPPGAPDDDPPGGIEREPSVSAQDLLTRDRAAGGRVGVPGERVSVLSVSREGFGG